MGTEVRGGFRMGNTCTPMADSCQCMAKPIQYCKVISLQLDKFILKRKKIGKKKINDLWIIYIIGLAKTVDKLKLRKGKLCEVNDKGGIRVNGKKKEADPQKYSVYQNK